MPSVDATADPAVARHPPGERAAGVLWSFGKCLGALLPVYLAGYYGFSISVVLFGLMIYMGWKHSRLEKVMKLKSAMYLLENEQEFTTAKVFRSKRDLPPWVNFPDVEKVEWLNKILQQAWPFIGQYLEKLLVETIAPAIRASSIHLQTLSFTKVNIGDKVVGVKAHTEHDKRQVMLDLYVSYAGDVEINVEIKKYFCKAGVKGVQLHGKLRVILEPLIGDVPLVGAITMFFIRRPKLDINWTGLTNLLDIPGLNAMSDTMIMDAIATHLVLPNRLTVPLVANLHVAQLRSPLPRGVVRIHLLEAENLTAKDTVIKGLIDGKSDPYAVLRVGTQIFTSHHVDSNLNPQWREMYEVIVHEVPGQELEVEVFDKDPDQDDFLGRDVPSGSVHLRLEWLSLLSSADRLSEVIQKNQNLTNKTADPPSAAILAVYLDQAHALPMRKGNKDPSPVVQISVQDATKESKTCYGTNSPVWEDAFTFFIQDPRKQEIDIQVKDDDRAFSLGSLTIPLSRLLSTPELTMDQWFQLENSGSASRIFIKIVLRVLWLNDEATPTTPSPRPSSSGSGPGHGGITSELNPMGPGGLAKPQPARPQHTTPDPEFATEGVLRIHLIEAQNLIAKDNFMGGMVKGKSDPYVKIRVAGITFRSHTIKENLNPVWNELYEVILTQLPGQEIQFELFDKDIDQDDFLGSPNQYVLIEWMHSLTCVNSKTDNTRCLGWSLTTMSACNLNVFVNVCVCFCVKLSHSWGQALGSVTLPLREVLADPGLVLDHWFSLDGALPESQILLRVTLKVLTTLCAYFLFLLLDFNTTITFLPFVFSTADNAGAQGQVKLTIGYSMEESRLFITVHACRCLTACSKDGADPYVTFILLPDKKATTKRRTATKKRDLNPEFNERFDFDFSLEESTQRRLDLSVKHSVSFMSREKELIGKLQLDLDQIDLKTGVTQWYLFY
uniref:Extended synaptotagmin-like protein 1a n=1 Tax=Sphaeramia orbicularis TaxID=375764 RepID=A0A673BUH2_9TELE